MGLKNYDPKAVQIVIAGIPIIEGFADGEFIRIERTTELFTTTIGTDGEVVRNRSNDNRALVTLLLLQTSSGNDVLSQLHNADRNRFNGAGVGQFLCVDGNGGSIYQAAECWVRKMPDVAFDREATSREWEIEIATLEDFTGGLSPILIGAGVSLSL
jgi:hypothetical protein